MIRRSHIRLRALKDLDPSPREARPYGKRSAIEEMLAMQIELNKIPEPEREHRFHEERRWRFDFAWPRMKLAAECEGGIWTKGRHTRGTGYSADLEKYNAAAIAGWLVLRFTKAQVQHGIALQLIQEALRIRSALTEA